MIYGEHGLDSHTNELTCRNLRSIAFSCSNSFNSIHTEGNSSLIRSYLTVILLAIGFLMRQIIIIRSTLDLQTGRTVLYFVTEHSDQQKGTPTCFFLDYNVQLLKSKIG